MSTQTAGPTPFELAGGPEVVRALAMRFYDEMETHEPALTAVHRQDAPGKVSAASREAFAMFLAYWLGGPQDYAQVHGHPRLRRRHGHVRIDAAMRDAWLRSMTRAMDGLGIGGEVRTFLDKRFADVADFLRNAPEAP